MSALRDVQSWSPPLMAMSSSRTKRVIAGFGSLIFVGHVIDTHKLSHDRDRIWKAAIAQYGPGGVLVCSRLSKP